jgi:hypothetical protein
MSRRQEITIKLIWDSLHVSRGWKRDEEMQMRVDWKILPFLFSMHSVLGSNHVHGYCTVY